MSEDFDFDAIKNEAQEQAKQEEVVKAAGGGKEEKSMFANWTKGPFIVAGIILAAIIIGLVIFLYVL